MDQHFAAALPTEPGNFHGVARSTRNILRVLAVLAIAGSTYGGPACPPPAAGAFTGCYYDNATLDGNLIIARTDSRINFDWSFSPPSPLLLNVMSARWQGNFNFTGGSYQFTAMTSDGMRVYIDGLLVLDRWRNQPTYMYVVTQSPSAGTHLITVEHYEHAGRGVASLSWQASAPTATIPAISSFTANPSTPVAGQSTTLNWAVSGATTTSIDNGVGDVSTVASKAVIISRTTTFLLTATNSQGSATAQLTVPVSSAPPPPPVPTAPNAPSLTTAVARTQAEVDLAWTASTDSVGVTGYQITRNGSILANVPGGTLVYSDTATTASTAYIYSVKAYNAAGYYSASSNTLSVTTPAATPTSTTITSCRDITQSGNYVLGANLTAASGSTCLNIHDTTNVQVDCQQFSITIDRLADTGFHSAIAVLNTANFAISNCSLKALNTTATASTAVVSVNSSPHGTIANSRLSGGCLDVRYSSGLNLSGNTFTGTPVGIYNSDTVTIDSNTVNLFPVMTYAGNIVLSRSTGSTIQNNHLDGGWDGSANMMGGDDGVLLDYVSDSVVQGNVISNIWDCGIENTGLMSNVRLLKNQVSKAKNCAVGGWYGSSWRGNTVQGNTVEDSSAILLIYRIWGLQSGETTVYFKDNIVRDNTLTRQAPAGLIYRTSYVDFQNGPVPADSVSVGNNVFSGNNFNAQLAAPMFFPASMIVDGGGNVCGTQNRQVDFPLQCGAPASQAPTAPTLVSAVAKSQTEVDLTWTASTGNATIAGYQLTRNASVIATMPATSLSYADSALGSGTSYAYSVKAYDSMGLYSSASNTMSATTPVQPPPPVSSGCPGPATNAFTGCYYNNLSLSGTPASVRTDNQISFWSWPYSVPANITAGNFSVSWQGNFTFTAGNYTFIVYTSDGMRMYIDGNLVLDRWIDQSVSGYSARQALSQGSHLIRVEYYNHNSGGQASLDWMKNN